MVSDKQWELWKIDKQELEKEITGLRAQIMGLEQKEEELESKELGEFLRETAQLIAKKYAAGFPPEERSAVLDKINEPLTEESERLAFFYNKQYRQGIKNFVGKWAMFSRNLAAGTMTMGDIWHQMWSNLYNLFFGPWVIGAAFVALQWLLISAYVPPSAAKPFLMIMAPIIGGGGVFMMNFMTSKNPMDWLTHIISGFIIAYASGMFWISIFGSINSFPGGVIWFWITWFLSGLFIGTFQLYQLGGFRAVMSFAVLILLFSYLALGPYQATYRQFIDRVKEPFTLAFRAIITSFNDAWILATNPTEWYARQQLRNVRSEKPLETPKGVEIIRLESLTPTVGIPAGEEFEIFTIIQNQGRMTARDVIAQISCNEFCDLPDNIDAQMKNQKDEMAKNHKDGLIPGDQAQIRFSGLHAKKPGRDAYQIAKVKVYVNYTYETNSTLPVTIADDAEIKRALAAKEDIFKPVPSIAMDGPAQLSLNVGPQPLQANHESSLLVAVLNFRPDGVIVLKKGDKIIVEVPRSIGTLQRADKDNFCRSRNLKCDLESGRSALENERSDRIACIVNPSSEYSELQIKATDFSTILPIFCSMKTTDATVFKSDRIKAEFPSYVFVTKKSLDVTVTQPLGVAKAPTPQLSQGTGEDRPSGTTPSGMTITPLKPGPPQSPEAELTGGPLGTKFIAHRINKLDEKNSIIFNTNINNKETGTGNGFVTSFLKTTEKSILEAHRQNILGRLKTQPEDEDLLNGLVGVEWAMEILPV